jgi:hypothetical protein
MRHARTVLFFAILPLLSACNTPQDVRVADAASQFKKGLITHDDFQGHLVRGGEPAIPEIIPLLLDAELRFYAMRAICLIERDYTRLHPMLWDAPVDEIQETVNIFATVAESVSPKGDSASPFDVMRLVREGKEQEAVALLQKLWSRKSR